MFICVGCVGCSSGHSWAPELRRPEGCSCGHCCWEGNSPPLINLWLTIEWSLFGQEIIFPPQSFQLLFLHWLRTSWIPCGKYISALISWAEEPQFLSWFQCTYTDDVQSICLVGLVLLIDWTGWGDPCRHCMRPGAREACNKPYESASKSIYLPLLSPWFVLGFSLLSPCLLTSYVRLSSSIEVLGAMQVCVSSVVPEDFVAAVEAGAHMVSTLVAFLQ